MYVLSSVNAKLVFVRFEVHVHRIFVNCKSQIWWETQTAVGIIIATVKVTGMQNGIS